MNRRSTARRAQPTRLRNLLILGAFLVMVLVGAAGRLKAEPGVVEVPDLGGVYTEAAIGNPSYLNPLLLQFNQLDRDLTSLIFTGLTRFDDNGQIVPDLAERWEIGDGGRSYIFRLRRDVRWHDRTPFTAGDVAFSVKAIQAPSFPGSLELAEFWRNVEVQAVDDFTVRFTLKEPYAPFLEYTTMGILPQHLYSDSTGKALTTSPYNLKPVGTGPFKLTKISSEGITLEPAPDYYGPAPHLAQLRIRFYADYTTARTALERGEVDGLPYLDPQDVTRESANEKLRVYSTPDYLRYSVLFLNNDYPVLKDKAVRNAISYGINRDRIVQTVLNGQGVPGKGPISPGSWAYDSKSDGYGFDPKKAEALLDSAGWRVASGNGVRERDGAQLSFVILTNDNQRRIKIGEMVAEDLRRIGFKSEVQAVGWTDLLREFLGPRTFTAVLAEQWLLTADPDVFSLWHSSQIENAGFNYSGLRNAEMDNLLETARGSMDMEKRKQLYSQFQSIWADQSPAVVLYYPTFNWAVSKTIRDVKLGFMADGSSRFRDAPAWYTKTKMVPVDKK